MSASEKTAVDVLKGARESVPLLTCATCPHERTCGYSMLATTGERDEAFSYGPCVFAA